MSEFDRNVIIAPIIKSADYSNYDWLTLEVKKLIYKLLKSEFLFLFSMAVSCAHFNGLQWERQIYFWENCLRGLFLSYLCPLRHRTVARCTAADVLRVPHSGCVLFEVEFGLQITMMLHLQLQPLSTLLYIDQHAHLVICPKRKIFECHR